MIWKILDSLIFMIDNFNQLFNKNRIYIVGDMLELGVETEKIHREAIMALSGEKTYFVGNNFYKIISGNSDLISENVKINNELNRKLVKQSNETIDNEAIKNELKSFIDVDSLIKYFEMNKSELNNKNVFIKGSNSIKLNKFVEFVTKLDM